MPSNDNFASASTISGASGSTTGTNSGATVESGEPGHYNYAPGPSYPVARAIVGPYATVWYAWTCPATAEYFFTTLDKTGGLATNFKSSVQVFTGSAVNALTAVTAIMDQSVGDGWGTDNGASIAFLATSGTTYYIQVDGRGSGVTGNFKLTWGPFQPITFGGCSAGVTLGFSQICFGTVTITDVTHDGYYPFGTIAQLAGVFVVKFVGGTNGCTTFTGSDGGGELLPLYYFPGVVCFSGTYEIVAAGTGAIKVWDPTGGTTYHSGDRVFGNGSAGALGVTFDYVYLLVATATVNPGSAGVWPQGGSMTGWSGGNCWAVYNEFSTQVFTAGSTGPFPGYPSAANHMGWSGTDARCSYSPQFTHTGGIVGMVFPAAIIPGTANSNNNPTVQLIYYPPELNATQGFYSFSGSGTSWSIGFYIQNTGLADLTGTTVTLQSTGGISSPSAPIVIDLSPGASTGVGLFTFTADPSSALITATLALTRNGVSMGTLVYPLYTVIVASFLNVANFERGGCSPKVWHNKLSIDVSWPAGGSCLVFPSAWGQNFAFAFTVVGGSPQLSNDPINPCTSVASIAGSTYAGFNMEPDIAGGSVAANVPVQCTFSFNGLALPAFSQTIPIPPA